MIIRGFVLQDLIDNGALLANPEAEFTEKMRWRQRVEEEIRRHVEKERKKNEKKYRRQKRDSTKNYEIRAPTSTAVPDPPAHNKIAQVARFIVHNSGEFIPKTFEKLHIESYLGRSATTRLKISCKRANIQIYCGFAVITEDLL